MIRQGGTVVDRHPRSLPALASFALSVGLIVSLAAVASLNASASGSGRISAHLTKTNFTVAQAGKVRLVYSFSSESRHFGYVISRKESGKWRKVRTVAKQGSFTGSHRITVKKLFAPKLVRAGKYRIKVSAAANSVTRKFAVTQPPRAGHWVATSLTGPVDGVGGGYNVTATSVSFDVVARPAAVSQFGFGYEWSGLAEPGQSCGGSGFSSIQSPTSPITDGQFSSPTTGVSSWSGDGSGPFHGTFDSATTAHGTAQLQVFVNGAGCYFPASTAQTGVFNWRATRK